VGLIDQRGVVYCFDRCGGLAVAVGLKMIGFGGGGSGGGRWVRGERGLQVVAVQVHVRYEESSAPQ